MPSQNAPLSVKRRAPSWWTITSSRISGLNEQAVRAPEQVMSPFAYPDHGRSVPGGSLSPLRGVLRNRFAYQASSRLQTWQFDNHAVPDAIMLRSRSWVKRSAIAGKRSGTHGFGAAAAAGWSWPRARLKVQLLAHSMGDLAALADVKATREEIANAFTFRCLS